MSLGPTQTHRGLPAHSSALAGKDRNKRAQESPGKDGEAPATQGGHEDSPLPQAKDLMEKPQLMVWTASRTQDSVPRPAPHLFTASHGSVPHVRGQDPLARHTRQGLAGWPQRRGMKPSHPGQENMLLSGHGSPKREGQGPPTQKAPQGSGLLGPKSSAPSRPLQRSSPASLGLQRGACVPKAQGEGDSRPAQGHRGRQIQLASRRATRTRHQHTHVSGASG